VPEQGLEREAEPAARRELSMSSSPAPQTTSGALLHATTCSCTYFRSRSLGGPRFWTLNRTVLTCTKATVDISMLSEAEQKEGKVSYFVRGNQVAHTLCCLPQVPAFQCATFIRNNSSTPDGPARGGGESKRAGGGGAGLLAESTEARVKRDTGPQRGPSLCVVGTESGRLFVFEGHKFKESRPGHTVRTLRSVSDQSPLHLAHFRVLVFC
jgi:hypothetical protein